MRIRGIINIYQNNTIIDRGKQNRPSIPTYKQRNFKPILIDSLNKAPAIRYVLETGYCKFEKFRKSQLRNPYPLIIYYIYGVCSTSIYTYTRRVRRNWTFRNAWGPYDGPRTGTRAIDKSNYH